MDKKLLELYSDYLLCSFGATTATGLSALLEGRISHEVPAIERNSALFEEDS